MNYLFGATIFLQTTEPVGVPGWVPVLIVIILLLLFWWGLTRNTIGQESVEHTDDHHEDTHHEDAEHEEVDVPVVATAVTATPLPVEETRTKSVPLAEPVEPDDLKKIEGIGPKIEGILHEAGIYTFSALAATAVPQLEKIVREDAGIRIAFPDTWPEQASLAASGAWEQLENLQDELKGGRRA